MRSTIDDIEARVFRLENRSERSQEAYLKSVGEIARFQERITRATSVAAGFAGAVALLYATKHWLEIGGWWPQAFAVVLGVVIYGLFDAWLDRWRLAEPPPRRKTRQPRRDGRGRRGQERSATRERGSRTGSR